MIVVYGTRLYGKVHACGGTFLATRFFHLWYLPLIPLGTQLVLGQETGGAYRFLPQRLSPLSLAAAVLRTWGLLAAIGVACVSIGGFVDAMEAHETTQMFLFPLLVFMTAAVAGASFWQLGRLSQAEIAQRAVYAEYLGHPLDPALFGEGRAEVRRSLVEKLSQRAQTLGLLGYRHEGSGDADFVALALDPTNTDVEYLKAALTLSRIEWVERKGEGRKQREREHSSIFAKLRDRLDADARAAAARAA